MLWSLRLACAVLMVGCVVLPASGQVSYGACSPCGYTYCVPAAPCYPIHPIYPCYPCHPVHPIFIPCHPCHPIHHCAQPDVTPLNPQPPHPRPGDMAAQHKLKFKNDTADKAFVYVYIKHPDGVFKLYQKKEIPANTPTVDAGVPYFLHDNLLFETWTQAPGTTHWHCRCVICGSRVIHLHGASSTFDVTRCTHSQP